MLRDFGLTSDSDSSNFQQGSGCSACNYTGYSKRLPIGEIWIPEYSELVALNKITDNLELRRNVYQNRQRLSLVEDGIGRVKAGETTLEELMRVIPYEQINVERTVERHSAKLIQLT
jgi:type IV pilus assembly protein PilB